MDRKQDTGNSEIYTYTKPIESTTALDRFFNFDHNSVKFKKTAIKIDWFILTYVCLGYFVKNLDQMNVRNAYVSGMQEDLNFHGKQYNYLQTWWLIGYIIGVIPAQVALCKVRASVLLPLLELCWSIVTICVCAVSDIKTLYGLRFLVGFFEAAVYPAFITLLGNWYTTSLGFKVTLIQISSSGAQMFLGYLQAALLKTMNGRGGLASWKWLFVFDGIIGIPVCIFGYLCIPDTPNNSRAWWLTPEEKTYCIDRMKNCGRKPYRKLSWNLMKNILSSWPLYLFTLIVIFHELSINLSTFMNLWIRSLPEYKNNAYLVNIIPTASYAVQIVVMIVFSILSDILKKRVPFICGYAFLGALGSLILLICEKQNSGNTKAKFAGWFILSSEMGFVTLLLTYLTEVLNNSAEQRTITIGITQAVGFAFQAWVPLLIYPANQAPHYKVGYQCAFAFFCVQIIMTCLVGWVYDIDLKGKLKFMNIKEEQEELDDGSKSVLTSNSDWCEY